jgi:predicted PurR-regulated permease PerM
VFVIAIVQGTIGGITFAMLGLRGAALLGVAMAAASIVPVIGTSLIWLPVAIVLFATGAWVKAILLLVMGFVVIGLIDNLLRPLLVGNDTRLPDYVVLLSTLGGLGLFGLSGFIVGPMIAAMCLATWTLYARENSPRGSA